MFFVTSNYYFCQYTNKHSDALIAITKCKAYILKAARKQAIARSRSGNQFIRTKGNQSEDLKVDVFPQW